MKWRLIKAFPKYAIALVAFLVSTGLFAVWWVTHRSAPLPQRSEYVPPPPEDHEWERLAALKREEIQKKAASLPARMGWLALVGSDLYDVSNGELIFKNWLGGAPRKLFYQPDTNRLMALGDRAVIRFATDGSKDGVMAENSLPAFTNDGKQAMFVKDGDVWVADVDWKGFHFTNERQATKLGQFNAAFFAANVELVSKSALLVRNQNKLLRVSLLTGDVQPLRIALGGISKRRSPDAECLVGESGKDFYAFDVGTGEAKTITVGRERLVAYQWLTNDICAFIVAGKGLALYHRKTNTLDEAIPLPFACNKIGGPSPTGRYVLCASRQGLALVDTQRKSAENFGALAQNFEWVSDDTLIYSRDVPDTSVRGTWLRTVGGNERQVMSEPYIVGRTETAAVGLMKEPNLVLFATRDTLFRMKPDGSDLQEVAKLTKRVEKIQAVEIWGE